MDTEKEKKDNKYEDIINKLCSFFDMDYSKTDDRIIINSFLIPYKCNTSDEMLEVINNLDNIIYGGKKLNIKVVGSSKPNIYNRKDNTIELNKHLISFGSDCICTILFHELGRAIFDNFYSRCVMGDSFYLLKNIIKV